MTEIPNIKGRYPVGVSPRDELGTYWHAHGMLDGGNPINAPEGYKISAWRTNPETGRIDEWHVGWGRNLDDVGGVPDRIQTPGEYYANGPDGTGGTVPSDSAELDPIRNKGIGSGIPFEDGDPDPEGTGLFYVGGGVQAFQRPFKQLAAEIE